MKTIKSTAIIWFSALWLVIGLLNSPAQPYVANFTGPSGGDWNNPGNWDTGVVPGVSTNVFVPTNTIVNYSSPMVADSIGVVTNNGGTLNVGAARFTVDMGGVNGQSIFIGLGSTMNILSGGVVTVTNAGQFFLNTNAVLTVNNATLTFTNTLGAYDLVVGRGGRNNGATVGLTNSTVTLTKELVIQGGGASGLPASSVYLKGGTLTVPSTGGATPSIIISNATDDAYTSLIVDGGATVQGGDFVVHRGIPSYGLIISNGTVTVSSLLIGTGASRAGANVYGGTLTNSGTFSMYNGSASGTSDRKAYFYQRGGTVVGTASSGLVLANPSANTATSTANQGAIYDITAGTLMVEGITLLANNTLVNVTARLNLGGTGTVYVGSGGLTANLGGSGAVASVSCTNGTLGAKADWTSGSAPILLNSGTTVFQAADAGGTAHNMILSAAVTGAGGLKKTGAGTLTLSGTNTYSGSTLISNGTLALGASCLISSPFILIGDGAALDVSAQGGAFSPGVTVASQTLSGFGTVNGLVTATNGIIQAGSNTITGKLTFGNGLTEPGGAINKFILSSDPVNGSNDLVAVTGNLTVSGTNTMLIVGSLPIGSDYPLMQYTGSFIGDVTNFALSGATGYLTNIVATKSIVLHTLATTRGPTTVTWLGNPLTNNWDTTISTNWLNAGSLDYFISGDNVRFNATGAANPNVNVVGSVLPASILVDAATDYAFTGGGIIDGSATLTKTNSGILTIGTANTYSGATTIGGGMLQVSNVANGNLPSPLGAASSDPANLVINGGTLKYFGANGSMDRGVTLGSASSTIAVTTNGNLTISGTLTGSGGLTKADNGRLILSGANNYTGATTLSNGTLQISSTAGALAGTVVFAGGTLSLNVGSQQIYPSPYSVVTTGLVVSAGGDNNVMQGAWSGSGTLTVQAVSGYFTLNANMTTNFTGTIRLTDDSAAQFRFNAGGSSSGPQQCTGSPTATFDLGNSSVILLNRNGGGSSNGNYYLGALAGGLNTTIRGSANAGSPSTYLIGGNNLSTRFSGKIGNGAGGTAATVGITKVGTGTLTFDGGVGTNVYTPDGGFTYYTNLVGSYTNMLYSGPTTISNGVLKLVVPVTLTNSVGGNPPTPITLASITAVLDATAMGYVSNEYDADNVTVTNVVLYTNGVLELAPNQSLGGIGTIQATNVLADANSILNPGLPLGTLTASQKIELAGAVNMSVNATGAPNCSAIAAASIVVDGTATLTVANLGPEAGATFHLFNQPVSGFASVNLPALTGTNSWINNLATDGSLTLLAPPAVPATPPAITNSFDAASGQLTLSWGAEYAGFYRLLAQTNAATVGLTTNWVEWTGASATNKVVIPVDTTKGTVFFRLVYP
ncbi:MAG TPA: autotransporter-associated beta strand repeat-containing protein [Candidatus Acidoferrum sp.]|nr:autotransporter-associated beta strand repeat-containing protein [Candidatus Acidoferrum sp.]